MELQSNKKSHPVPILAEKILKAKSRELLIRLYIYGAFERLYRLGEFFHESLSNLKIEKGSMPYELLVLHLLFLRVIDLSRSIKILIAAKNYRGIPLLSKALLEALFDLRCQYDDKNHYKSIQAASDKEEIKFYEFEVQNRKLCEEEFPGEYGNIKRKLAEAKQMYSQLGVRPLKIFEKAKKANLLGIYNTQYMELNQHTHNDMTLLHEYHNINKSHESCAQYYRICIPDSKPEDALLHLMIANRCLGDALLVMISVHEQDSSLSKDVSDLVSGSEYLCHQRTLT